MPAKPTQRQYRQKYVQQVHKYALEILNQRAKGVKENRVEAFFQVTGKRDTGQASKYHNDAIVLKFLEK